LDKKERERERGGGYMVGNMEGGTQRQSKRIKWVS